LEWTKSLPNIRRQNLLRDSRTASIQPQDIFRKTQRSWLQIAQVANALKIAEEAGEVKQRTESAMQQQFAEQEQQNDLACKQMKQAFESHKAALEEEAHRKLEEEHQRMQAELAEAKRASFEHHSNAAQAGIATSQRNQEGLHTELVTMKEAKSREEEQRRQEIERAMEKLPKRRRATPDLDGGAGDMSQT
jgi:hypothetical protein